jgi:hypothetical protein
MSDKLKIDVALANLEAGKFSFRTVDAVKGHISRLESDLVHRLHANALADFKRQELTNWRQEGELRKLNATIYALLRANMLTEKAYEGTTSLVIKMAEYFQVSRKFAGASFGRAMAILKSGKLKSQAADATSWIHALLKETLPTKDALERMTPYVSKAVGYLEIFKKYAGAYLEKASAYLSTLHKTAA